MTKLAREEEVHQDDILCMKFNKIKPALIIVGSSEGCFARFDLSMESMEDVPYYINLGCRLDFEP